jgi:transposase
VSLQKDRRNLQFLATAPPIMCDNQISPAKRGGKKRHVEVREVMNAIMYILSTECQWRAIPKALPPRSTLFDYLDLWSYDGTLEVQTTVEGI